MQVHAIGSIRMSTGHMERHFLCRLSQDEWEQSDLPGEQAEDVRVHVERQAARPGLHLEVSVLEHPTEARAFIAIVQETYF